jgi:pimeloyl-ACP methyl ester carboxylesterase
MRRRALAVLSVALVVILLWRPAGAHVRAASLLVRFVEKDPHGLTADLANAVRHPVDERDTTVPTARGDTRARLLVPRDVSDLSAVPGLVLVHGVHFQGIDEPRLRAFARTIAESGVAVLTPEVPELCDYRIDPASVDTIASAAHVLSARLGGGRPVGVMGLSFAGGLAILAAAEPRTARDIAYVVSVGGHDDMGRVLRFFATDRTERPDGSIERMHAHDYGPVVLVYSHAEDFFAGQDLPVARDALRLWLHEDFDRAREVARGLSAAGQAKMGLVFDHRVSELAPELLGEIARLEPQLAAVSPSAALARVSVPVFLLHGAGDNVIPASETLWLAHDLPAHRLRASLVSPAIQHVELQGEPSLGDELALVHFLSDVLEEATDTMSPQNPPPPERNDHPT